MLLSNETLIYYGSGAAAMVDTQGTVEVQLGIKGTARFSQSTQGGMIQPYLKPTRLVNSPLLVQGKGDSVLMLPKGRARCLLDVSIGAIPSALDIAQAVLNAVASQYNNPGTIGEKINASGSSTAGGLTTTEHDKLMSLPEADEVVTAISDAVVPVNTVQIKGQPISGAGTESDPWGP